MQNGLTMPTAPPPFIFEASEGQCSPDSFIIAILTVDGIIEANLGTFLGLPMGLPLGLPVELGLGFPRRQERTEH